MAKIPGDELNRSYGCVSALLLLALVLGAAFLLVGQLFKPTKMGDVSISQQRQEAPLDASVRLRPAYAIRLD